MNFYNNRLSIALANKCVDFVAFTNVIKHFRICHFEGCQSRRHANILWHCFSDHDETLYVIQFCDFSVDVRRDRFPR